MPPPGGHSDGVLPHSFSCYCDRPVILRTDDSEAFRRKKYWGCPRFLAGGGCGYRRWAVVDPAGASSSASVTSKGRRVGASASVTARKNGKGGIARASSFSGTDQIIPSQSSVASVCRPNVIVLRFHHGGFFQVDKFETFYNCGSCAVVEIDVDELSWFGILGIIKDDLHVVMADLKDVQYRVPGFSLDSGLRSLSDDASVMELQKWVRHGVPIDVYCQHDSYPVVTKGSKDSYVAATEHTNILSAVWENSSDDDDESYHASDVSSSDDEKSGSENEDAGEGGGGKEHRKNLP